MIGKFFSLQKLFLKDSGLKNEGVEKSLDLLNPDWKNSETTSPDLKSLDFSNPANGKFRFEKSEIEKSRSKKSGVKKSGTNNEKCKIENEKWKVWN